MTLQILLVQVIRLVRQVSHFLNFFLQMGDSVLGLIKGLDRHEAGLIKVRSYSSLLHSLFHHIAYHGGALSYSRLGSHYHRLHRDRGSNFVEEFVLFVVLFDVEFCSPYWLNLFVFTYFDVAVLYL